MINYKTYLKKNFIFKTLIFDLDAFIQDGFNRKAFDKNGFNINGINGFNRIKELVCEEKIKYSIRENPWKIYYVSEVFRNKYEISKECVGLDPNTYQYATLKQNVDVAILFLERGGSFSSKRKHLRNIKKVGKMADKNNHNSFHYVGENLKGDVDIFKLALKQNEKKLRYASERLRKVYRTHSC